MIFSEKPVPTFRDHALCALQRSVNAALEPAIGAQCAMVGKRQNLRPENSRHVLRRSDLVVRIEKAGPGHASGAAPLRHRLHVDHVTQAPSETYTGKEVHI